MRKQGPLVLILSDGFEVNRSSARRYHAANRVEHDGLQISFIRQRNGALGTRPPLIANGNLERVARERLLLCVRTTCESRLRRIGPVDAEYGRRCARRLLLDAPGIGNACVTAVSIILISGERRQAQLRKADCISVRDVNKRRRMVCFALDTHSGGQQSRLCRRPHRRFDRNRIAAR